MFFLIVVGVKNNVLTLWGLNLQPF